MQALVISTQPEFRNQIASILTEFKAELFSATDSQQGLKILKEEQVDSILIDSRLKDLQIGKLIRKILEKSPLSDILAARESSSDISSEELFSYGADEIVEIPLNPEELSFKVKNLW